MLNSLQILVIPVRYRCYIPDTSSYIAVEYRNRKRERETYIDREIPVHYREQRLRNIQYWLIIYIRFWHVGRQGEQGSDCDPRQILPPREDQEEARLLPRRPHQHRGGQHQVWQRLEQERPSRRLEQRPSLTHRPSCRCSATGYLRTRENFSVRICYIFFCWSCTVDYISLKMAQLRYPYTLGAMVRRFPLRYYIGKDEQKRLINSSCRLKII